MFVEGLIRRFHAQVRIENQQRRDGLDDGLGIIARFLELLLGALERVQPLVGRRVESRTFPGSAWLGWRAAAYSDGWGSHRIKTRPQKAQGRYSGVNRGVTPPCELGTRLRSAPCGQAHRQSLLFERRWLSFNSLEREMYHETTILFIEHC